MEVSSHVTANLDQWIENGFINIEQREAIFQLIAGAVQDGYDQGLANADCSANYDDGVDAGYDNGWHDGYESGKAEFAGQRDEWFEQGWAAAIAEHGIEE